MNDNYIENEIVKNLCVGKYDVNPQPDQILQYKVLGLLCMHRCAGIAYHNLKQHGQLPLLNREARNTLHTIYEDNVRKNHAMRQALNYLHDVFSDVRFPYALLKGAKLIDLYSVGTRTSNDIDILITRESIPQITELLLKEGFQQGYIRNDRFVPATRRDIVNALLNRGETTPFIKQVDWDGMRFLELDINISIDETNHGKGSVVKEMLEHAVPDIAVGNGRLFTLDAVDFFIHLCVHLYKEASVYLWVQLGRDLSLYKFLDIYVYWKNCMNGDLLPVLKERTEKYDVGKAVYYALSGTNQIWNLDDDRLDVFLKELAADNVGVLDIVYDPTTKLIFKYEDAFEARIFDEQHMKNLKKYTVN